MKSFEEYLRFAEKLSFLRDEQWRIERDRRRTREEKKLRRIIVVLDTILVLIFVAMLIAVLTTEAASEEANKAPVSEAEEWITILPTVTREELERNREPSYEAITTPAQDPITYEDLFRERGTYISDCKITHYCTELRPHICGNGDGLTSTGVPVTAYWTCAVDPSVIPYGAEVMVDYGDHVEFWKAQDCGGSVKGNHVDLAVEHHDEAYDLGVKYTSVYWAMPEDLE